jgi:hypothetical protein
MAYLPRGIAPEILISQIKNTAPYLFEGEIPAALTEFVPTQTARASENKKTEDLDHFQYYKLCLSAHYLTCGTPVPTDVDNQIRQKLWPAELPLETALQMADLVLESRKWDFTQVSTRFVLGARGSKCESEVISGHLGEWFTVSSGAYCALKQYRDPAAESKRQELFENIGDEVRRHAEIFGSLWNAHDGIGSLKACSSVAHNFGDLDRVMDMWDLAVNDPLRLEFYKLSSTPFDSNRKLRYLGRLWVAGELYKSQIDGSSMAQENHRHFALRKPKCLRQRPAYLIPTGPFFDDWGAAVARGLGASDGQGIQEVQEVFDALIHGWERLGRAMGYGRALRAMHEVDSQLNLDSLMKNHEHRRVLETPQAKFEKKWAEEAVILMEDIPSRA